MPTLADYHVPYPAASAGMKRCVIYLDPMGDEAERYHYKVELIPGRITYCLDPEHTYLQGVIEEQVIDGWGYSYFVVQMGHVIDAHGKPVSGGSSAHFVSLAGTGPQLPYSSTAPLVVYVPQDAEVRYRVWVDEAIRAQGLPPVSVRTPLSTSAAPRPELAAPPSRAATPPPEYPSPPSQDAALPPPQYAVPPSECTASPLDYEVLHSNRTMPPSGMASPEPPVVQTVPWTYAAMDGRRSA
ncbi:ecotin [Strigomonas culicis]|uniref:Ecotin n=1 Tax=Strigomonas culicis TaxID=28005 RepID=S9ULP4_9TRYP|nr:ecotin [Strigomonas culicis]|eukprot:EPY31772.1 ecotin [Strigomonas culicis]